MTLQQLMDKLIPLMTAENQNKTVSVNEGGSIFDIRDVEIIDDEVTIITE